MVIVLTLNDKHFERKFGADQPLKMAGTQGRIQGGGARAPSLTTKNEAQAPKFYKTEAPEWQF